MKILIIDDSSLSRRILKKALGESHTFLEADDGLHGLELFSLQKPDLVILDITMPGINGMEVLSSLRQLDPNCNVIIGTADQQNLTRQEALRLGARGFITKPYVGNPFKNILDEITG